MKNKILIPSIIILGLGLFFSFKYFNSETDTQELKGQNEIILQTNINVIKANHFSPRPIDDTFSAIVFNDIIKSLDYEKKFFTEEQIHQLSTYKYKIDDQINEYSLAFFDTLNTLFNQQIAFTKSIYKEILNNPYSFDGNDEIELDFDKINYVKNEDELKERWRKGLKYRVLIKYNDLKEEEEKKSKEDTKYKQKTDKVLEKEARESIGKIQERVFKRLEKLNYNDRFSIYMNSITSTFDPHTNYMQPNDKKKFDEMMSGSFVGIGATLQLQEDGTVKITSLLTGSPAWKSGKLKAEDIIEKVGQGANATPVDIDGSYELEDVVKMIRGKVNTDVALHIRHTDGTKEVITLTRSKIEIEELFAKSNIIEENGNRIGYIYLPEFYADFSNPREGRRSAKDVEIEVKKLIAENVDGIILDLRNNGGGSLSDVVDMTGLFIGKGPVVQVKAAGDQSITLSSKTEPIYTGPLAVMINTNSASASEILAAAIQDYQRGVVIGTTSFGKGTVQKIESLDRFVNANARKQIIDAWIAAKSDDVEYDGIGSLKLTIQKFYRINGGSTQLKGVTPDIMLPDAFELVEKTGERKDNTSLPWDKINPVKYNQFYDRNGFVDLANLSKIRIDNNNNFKLIKETANLIKQQRDENKMPLNEKRYLEKLDQSKSLTKKIDELDSLSTGLKIINLKTDMVSINVDTATVEKNNKRIDQLKKDPYISESTSIISDWINGNVKFTMLGRKN